MVAGSYRPQKSSEIKSEIELHGGKSGQKDCGKAHQDRDEGAFEPGLSDINVALKKQIGKYRKQQKDDDEDLAEKTTKVKQDVKVLKEAVDKVFEKREDRIDGPLLAVKQNLDSITIDESTNESQWETFHTELAALNRLVKHSPQVQEGRFAEKSEMSSTTVGSEALLLEELMPIRSTDLAESISHVPKDYAMSMLKLVKTVLSLMEETNNVTEPARAFQPHEESQLGIAPPPFFHSQQESSKLTESEPIQSKSSSQPTVGATQSSDGVDPPTRECKVKQNGAPPFDESILSLKPMNTTTVTSVKTFLSSFSARRWAFRKSKESQIRAQTRNKYAPTSFKTTKRVKPRDAVKCAPVYEESMVQEESLSGKSSVESHKSTTASFEGPKVSIDKSKKCETSVKPESVYSSESCKVKRVADSTAGASEPRDVETREGPHVSDETVSTRTTSMTSKKSYLAAVFGQHNNSTKASSDKGKKTRRGSAESQKVELNSTTTSAERGSTKATQDQPVPDKGSPVSQTISDHCASSLNSKASAKCLSKPRGASFEAFNAFINSEQESAEPDMPVHSGETNQLDRSTKKTGAPCDVETHKRETVPNEAASIEMKSSACEVSVKSKMSVRSLAGIFQRSFRGRQKAAGSIKESAMSVRSAKSVKSIMSSTARYTEKISVATGAHRDLNVQDDHTLSSHKRGSASRLAVPSADERGGQPPEQQTVLLEPSKSADSRTASVKSTKSVDNSIETTWIQSATKSEDFTDAQSVGSHRSNTSTVKTIETVWTSYSVGDECPEICGCTWPPAWP